MNTFMYETTIPFAGNDNWFPKNPEYTELQALTLKDQIHDKYTTHRRVMTVRDILIDYGNPNPSPALGLVGWDPKKDQDICFQYELMEDGIILRITAHLLL